MSNAPQPCPNDYSNNAVNQNAWSSDYNNHDARRSNLVYGIGAAVTILVILIVWKVCRQRRATKRAKLQAQDDLLNLPVAIPFETIEHTPQAYIIDVSTDNDHMIPPASAPPYVEIITPRR